MSSLYKSLRRCDILQEPRLLVEDVQSTLYLIRDSAYPIRTYLQKNCKAHNDLEKKRFDKSMNSGRVVIKQVFGTLKNRWRILKNFNFRVDRSARITIACCSLHNYCEMMNQPKPDVQNPHMRRDPHVRFGNERLPIYREGEQSKKQGEFLKQSLLR